MKVKELKFDQIVAGLRMKSLNRDVYGTITEITDKAGGDWNAWITWDGDSRCYSGFEFYASGEPSNTVECEVLCDAEGKPIVIEV